MTAFRHAPRAFALPAFVLPVLALLIVGAPVAVPNAARAQTPVTTIENANGNVVLESYDDGALLAPEVFSGPDAIPAEGQGRRMMWYADRAAFRAGRVTGDQWDKSNIGVESVAFGKNTTASGFESTAMGLGTTASSKQSTAMGRGTTASGRYSTAMGYLTTASGNQSTAMGRVTTASDFSSTAMGSRAAAEADYSFVWNDASEYHDIPNFSYGGLSSDKAVNGEPVTGDKTFSVSAQGGVRFITGSSSVTYIDGGTTGWSTTSTRSAKTDVTRADPTAVLEAVEAMPISTWEYKTESGEGAGTRHIGPMAEDFHGALPYDLGSSAEHINSLNADGVALGAVKGLARKVKRQKEKIAALKAESRDQQSMIEEQNKRIDRLEKRLAALEAEASAVPAAAGMMGTPEGSWGLALLVGLSGLAGGILWRRRRS
jgi:hypothetical protein